MVYRSAIFSLSLSCMYKNPDSNPDKRLFKEDSFCCMNESLLYYYHSNKKLIQIIFSNLIDVNRIIEYTF